MGKTGSDFLLVGCRTVSWWSSWCPGRSLIVPGLAKLVPVSLAFYRKSIWYSWCGVFLERYQWGQSGSAVREVTLSFCFSALVPFQRQHVGKKPKTRSASAWLVQLVTAFGQRSTSPAPHFGAKQKPPCPRHPLEAFVRPVFVLGRRS